MFLITESQSEHDGGWNGESRITLRAQANYNGKRLVCSVLYPDNKTYQKLTVTVAVERSECRTVQPCSHLFFRNRRARHGALPYSERG